MQVIWQKEAIPIDFSFMETVNRRSGQQTQLCYHCRKCGAGCPVVSYMDYTPDKLFRMAQLGLERQVLSSSTIWLCSSCHTCATRCPNDIDVTRVMDTLKEFAAERKVGTRQKRAVRFHKAFLSNLRRFGRIHEASLTAGLKLMALDLFSDLKLGLNMFRKGKIALLPRWIGGKAEIRKLFRETRKRGQMRGEAP